MKTCTKCKAEKPLEAFGKMSASRDGLHYWCKECVNAQSREWKAANAEHIAEYNRSCDKEYKRKAAAKYREKNPEAHKEAQRKSRAKRKEKRYQEQKQWRAENPDKVKFYNASRKRSVRRATPSWLTKDLKKFIEIQYCMATLLSERMGEEYHVDHIHPLNHKDLCGLHVPWNLRVITAEENTRKNNLIIPEVKYVW
jgi:hypothetical protein